MAIRNLRLNNGETIELDEWLSWPLFSTVEFAKASRVKLPSFSYTVGQPVPRAGLAKRLADPSDTNMVIAKKINHDEAFVAFSITYEAFGLDDDLVDIGPATLAVAPLISANTLKRMQAFMTLSFKVGTRQSKPQAAAPLAWFAQGAGPVIAASSGTVGGGVNTSLSVGTAGCPSPRNQRRFPMPIFVQSDRKISVDVETPRGPIPRLGQDVRLRLYLDGIKRRPVA